MTKSIDQLRRDAKALHKAHEQGDSRARDRVKLHPPRPEGAALRRSDFLHVVAQEAGFDSWPQLKLSVETMGMDRAARLQRLKIALAHGQVQVIERLMTDTPDLAAGHFGLECALYDLAAVKAALADDPGRATRLHGPKTPILHLAFSRYHHLRPDLRDDMLAIADLLLAHGADVNDAQSDPPLSALYGAIGHADNLALGKWLLEHGANPNDGESLYHATELGHHEGLRLLLAHGADPKGTNALLRAMDFHDVEAVRMLVAAGARVDDAQGPVPALHQAARRMSPRPMIDLLLEAGADSGLTFHGVSVFSMARVHGNSALTSALEERGVTAPLGREEALLARAADGLESPGEYIDPAKLLPAYANLIRNLVQTPGPDRIAHIDRLVRLGVPHDTPDREGITPVQIAGWEGLPDYLSYFLGLHPDLSHTNGYGGTLLSTIIHGSENAPDRSNRDHLACLRLALEQGVALPRRAIALAGEPEVAEFLGDWAEDHPGQLVD